MASHARPRLWSRIVVDGAVLLFALWTVACHLVVVRGGNGNDLVWAAVAVLCFATACAWLARRRGWGAGPGPEDERARALDDRPDRVARALAVAVVFVLVAIWWSTRNAWATWIACLLATAGWSAWWFAEPVVREAPPEAHRGSDRRSEIALWCLVGCAGLFTLILHRDNSDDAFYVNVAVTLVDFPERSLFSYDAVHGLARLPPVFYRVASYELLGGTISRVTGLSALSSIHHLLGTLGGMALPLALARLFRILDPVRWPWMVAAGLSLYVFDGSSQFSFSMHGFARIYQGKAILWSVMVPLVTAYGIAFAMAPSTQRLVLLAAGQIAGLGLSSTGLWLMPFTGLLSVCVPLAVRPGSIRVAALGSLGAAYPLAVAASIWASRRDNSRGGGVGHAATASPFAPDFEPIAWSLKHLFGGEPLALSYLVMLGLATGLAHGRLARRYVALFSLFAAAIFLNPFLHDALARNVVGRATHDRMLWLLPVPGALALCATALVAPRGARRLGGLLAGAIALSAFYALVPVRTNAPRAQLRFPPGPKVRPVEFEAAQRLTRALPPGSTVLAPRWVAVNFPLLHGALHPVIAKEVFFRARERERRLALVEAVAHRGPEITRTRARWLRAELRAFDVAGIVSTRWAMKTRGLVEELTGHGFEPLTEVGPYHLWRRRPGGAHPAARPARSSLDPARPSD